MSATWSCSAGGPAQLALELRASARGKQLTIDEELALAVEGADLDRGRLARRRARRSRRRQRTRPTARERFALLDAELRTLRRYAGEPLLDLVRRIIDTTGIDIELASSVSPAARARRDNLDIFVKAVAEFEAVDGDVTLPALLAYLQAEDEFGNGLDIATPTEADSVKLLTVHRAKGLEWPAVFLVGVCEERFPNNRTRVKWTSGPGVLPIPLRGDRHDQPQLPTTDAAVWTPSPRPPATTRPPRSCGWGMSRSLAPSTCSSCLRTAGAAPASRRSGRRRS